MTKGITDILNISPVTVELEEVSENYPMVIEKNKELNQDEKDFEDDFEIVRANLKNLIDKGDEALESILNLADASMQPRAYEIAAMTLKTLVESNMNALDIHEKRRKMKEKTGDTKTLAPSVTNINNAVLFSGSTSEILKRLNK